MLPLASKLSKSKKPRRTTWSKSTLLTLASLADRGNPDDNEMVERPRRTPLPPRFQKAEIVHYQVGVIYHRLRAHCQCGGSVIGVQTESY